MTKQQAEKKTVKFETEVSKLLKQINSKFEFILMKKIKLSQLKIMGLAWMIKICNQI